jgi:hypothetical protein
VTAFFTSCITFNQRNVDVFLTISSEPSGARIYEEGNLLGNTPLTLTYTFQSSANGTFSPKTGFRKSPNRSFDFPGAGHRFESPSLSASELEMSPQTGGNQYKTRSFTAIKDGYRAQTRIFQFSADDLDAGKTNFSLLFILEPLEAKPQQQQQQQQQQTTVVFPTTGAPAKAFGTLTIITTPSQAEVYVDGGFVATTPVSNLQLEAGFHKIDIQKSGYKTWTRNVQVLANSPVKIEIEL